MEHALLRRRVSLPFFTRYLMKFCAVIAEHHEVNKMSPFNLALVIAPNLLWPNVDDIR